jgi:hypothetical protein
MLWNRGNTTRSRYVNDAATPTTDNLADPNAIRQEGAL